jgi:hypothetical protein
MTNDHDTDMTEVPSSSAAAAAAETSFYKELVVQLQHLVQTEDAAAASSQEMARRFQACIAEASRDIQNQTTHRVFVAGRLTDELARILLLKEEHGGNQAAVAVATALEVVQVLVRMDDGATFLPCLAKSVARTVRQCQEHEHAVHVSTPLLKLWMHQLVYSDVVSVHAHLLDALVRMSSIDHDGDVLSRAVAMLVDVWKQQQTTSTSKENASVVCVRCATLWVQWLQTLGGAAILERSREAQDLFLDMINGFDDPLQQLAVMDLLNEHFGKKDTDWYATDHHNGSGSTVHMDVVEPLDDALQEWLASPPLLSPILQMLQDPILSGSALQYVSDVLVTWRASDVVTVLDYIRQVGVVSNETERLKIVHAMSNIAPLAMPEILRDATLRHAWWDTSRITQSKLQAAILVSVAMALPKLPSTMAMDTYNCLGPDNGTTMRDVSTTQWVLERFVASPMTELRVAAYALLSAKLKLDKAPHILALNTSKDTQSALLELLMDPQHRENTADARIAYFDVVKDMHDLLDGSSDGTTNIWVSTMNSDQLHKVKQQLHKKIQMGPHGREPLRWDVATE